MLPRVEISKPKDMLIAEFRKPITMRRATPSVFYEFVRLDHPDNNEAIRRFAAKWGMIGLCRKHLRPCCGHPSNETSAMVAVDDALIVLPGSKRVCKVRTWTRRGEMWIAEPLSVWRDIIRLTAAILRIGSEIKRGGNGREEDWLTVMPDSVIQKNEQQPWKHPRYARWMLGGTVQHWLTIGNVRPAFYWNENEWTIRHTVPKAVFPLFGWLSLRLMIEIAGGRSIVCPYCHHEYFPDRLPGNGQDHHCGADECRKAYSANYKRKYRSRV